MVRVTWNVYTFKQKLKFCNVSLIYCKMCLSSGSIKVCSSFHMTFGKLKTLTTFCINLPNTHSWTITAMHKLIVLRPFIGYPINRSAWLISVMIDVKSQHRIFANIKLLNYLCILKCPILCLWLIHPLTKLKICFMCIQTYFLCINIYAK